MRRIITLLIFALISADFFGQTCSLDDVIWEIDYNISRSFCPGSSLKFESVIKSGEEYYYQWYKDDIAIGDMELSDMASLTKKNFIYSDSGQYQVRGYLGHPDTSSCYSSSNYISVSGYDEIIIEDFVVTDVIEGTTAQLEILAVGDVSPFLTGFLYTWYHNDIQIGTADFSNVLELQGVVAERGEYYVTVSGGVCVDVSSETKFLDIITGIEDKVLYNNKEVEEVYNTMGQEVSLETANQTIIVKYTDGTSERIYNVR